MFQTNNEQIETYILCSIQFSLKLCRLRGNVEECGGARQAAGGNIKRRLLFPCWISKVTSTPEYVPLTAFSRQE